MNSSATREGAGVMIDAGQNRRARVGTEKKQGTMPDELNTRHVWRRMAELAAAVAVIGLLVLVGPGLGTLRRQIARGSPGWLAAGVGLEALSALSYVLIFRAVFCPRMTWRLSYDIAMAEQGTNSIVSVSGAGGLALGAWALRRSGMSVEHIGRRTVAFLPPHQHGQCGRRDAIRRSIRGRRTQP